MRRRKGKMPAVFGWRRSFRLAAEFPALIGPLVAERYREREKKKRGGGGRRRRRRMRRRKVSTDVSFRFD